MPSLRAGGFRISDGFISPLDLVEAGLHTAEEAAELHALETSGAERLSPSHDFALYLSCVVGVPPGMRGGTPMFACRRVARRTSRRVSRRR